MNQREAVIKVMEDNGGYATLGHLYEHTLDVPNVEWKTKTPFASMRRIVQNPKYFFKIRPGLWALNDYKDKLPFKSEIEDEATEERKAEFSHSYYQGLLVEIGNLSDYATFVPPQDQNKNYLEKSLKDVMTMTNIYDFSYPEIVNVAKVIDVSWFNTRKMPSRFIEVEHTTDIFNSLRKFTELQDFFVDFWIAAPTAREREFENKVSRGIFEKISNRVKFVSYEKISRLHANLIERKFEIGL